MECGGLTLGSSQNVVALMSSPLFLPNGELVATQWNSVLVSMLLTDFVLFCIFSDKLDTCDLLFDQLVIFLFYNNNNRWVLFPL